MTCLLFDDQRTRHSNYKINNKEAIDKNFHHYALIIFLSSFLSKIWTSLT
jgi:hypothetical protein